MTSPPGGTIYHLRDGGELTSASRSMRAGRLKSISQYMASRAPFGPEERRDALRERLNAISGVTIERSALARRPIFSVRLLEEPAACAAFVAAYDWYVGELGGPT